MKWDEEAPIKITTNINDSDVEDKILELAELCVKICKTTRLLSINAIRIHYDIDPIDEPVPLIDPIESFIIPMPGCNVNFINPPDACPFLFT